MSGYLAYSYSICLTKEEENEINRRVVESQKELSRGFNTGLKMSLTLYSIYSITTRAAYASDSCPTTDTCPVPSQANGSQPNKAVVKPKPKPGFKPVPAGAKGVAIGGAGGVCTAALQSGDFVLGLLCAGLLIGIGIINNRE